MAEPLAGVVLAGGQSTRLGHDKRNIRLYGEEGPDLLTRSVALLRLLLPRVVVSCRAGAEQPQYECVPDQTPDLGPIAGVHAALTVTGSAVLALSCDMPFMDETTLRRLIQAWEERPRQALMVTFRLAGTDHIEALAAIYCLPCLPLFGEAIAGGKRQPGRVVPPEQRIDVIYTRQESLPFFNINYPADLEMARSILRSLGQNA